MPQKLTEAEKELLEVLRENPAYSYNQIAERLGKSPKTVDNQMRRLYAKAGIDGGDGSNKIVVLMKLLGWFKPMAGRKIPKQL